MKTRILIQTMLFMVAAVILSGLANAQTCEGTLSAPTEQVYVGNPINITFFNGDLNSSGYNATLAIPPELTLTGSSPNPLEITGINPVTKYVWEVVPNAVGNYTVNVTVTSPTGDCVITFGPVEVIEPVDDPNLILFVSDMGSLILGQTYTEQVTVHNLGPGIAYNVQGMASTAAGQDVTPLSFSTSTIGNTSGNDSHVVQFSVTPNTCGNNDEFTVYVNNYEDGEGNLMPPVSGSDTFDVIGTDLTFNSLTATNVEQGTDTVIGYQVENIGALDATAASVEIYVDGSLETTRNLGAVGTGDVVNDSFTYSTSSKTVGDHNITAVITGSAECASSNNEAEAVFTVSASSGPVCGNGVCEAGETCSNCPADCGSCSSGGGSSGGGSGGGGGGSSRIFYLDLSEEKPEVTLPLRRGDTVKYDWEGKSYSFIIRQVYTDRMKMGVSESVSYTTYDMKALRDYELNLDETPEGDLGVRPKPTGNSNVDVTFSLLGIDKKKVVDVLPPGSVDRRVVEVGEETVPVESRPVDRVRETVQDYAEGMLTFVEELSVKSKAPVWGGLALALAIVILGSLIYFGATKDREERK